MRKKKKPNNDIFEITDFTNATPFEDFVAAIEQIIDVWALTHGKSWKEDSIPAFTRSESVTYNYQSFRLTHHTLQCERVEHPLQQATFPSKTHCLHRWYGLSEFLILSPETTEDAVFFLDTSKLLLSSLACALTRTKCSIPTFIQLGSPSKRFYSGIWLNNSLQTTLEMVLLKKPPPQCSSLKEVLCFYKRSVPCAVSPFPCIYVSVRYTFSLFNFIGSQCMEHLFDNEDKSAIRLPMGTARDPIQDLLLATTWQGLSEHLVSDSESGELDPFRAPFWSLRYTATSNPFCLLSNYLDYVVTMVSSQVTLVQLLGTSEDAHELDVQNAFGSLSQLQIPTFDITMLPGKLLGTYGALVKSVVIEELLDYIFARSYDESLTYPRIETKTCPSDSLSYRISICLCCVLCYDGGLKGYAQLWKCILERLRAHYEEGKLIPRLSSHPDAGLCLFHQKLQMINACIVQKKEREQKSHDLSDDQTDSQKSHPTLKILLTNAPVVIPVIQKHSPMTEDMQEAHAEALTKLGSSAEGSRLRAQLHSVALLSDMQAFKAANPDCRLEDFIRWYSPRDWISVPITKPLIIVKENDDLNDALEDDDVGDGGEILRDDTSDVSSAEFEDLENEGQLTSVSEVVLDEVEKTEEDEDEEEGEDENEDEKGEDEDEKEEDENEEDEKEEVAESKDEKERISIEGDMSVDGDCSDGDPVIGDDEEVVGESAEGIVESVEEGPLQSTTEHSDTPAEEDMGIEDRPNPKDELMQVDTVAKIDDEDDEFVDAEEEFMECESSTQQTKSESFQSASEASLGETMSNKADETDRLQSIEPFPDSSPEDEFALSHISSSPEISAYPNLEQSVENITETSPTIEPEKKPVEEALDPDVVGGHLSSRMAKDSTWSETWRAAKPVPIWHQKRLFDDTKETEKVLHYFSHAEIKVISLLILPPLLQAALDRLKLCKEAVNVTHEINLIHDQLKNLHRYSSTDTEYLQEIIVEIQKTELLISKYKSLTAKLHSQSSKSTPSEATSRKITQLEKRTRRLARPPKLAETSSSSTVETDEQGLLTSLITSEIELAGGVKSCWGPTLQRLFHAQQQASIPVQHGQTPPSPQHIPIFPNPMGREYILQTVTSHPSSVSRSCPQRMFCAVSGNEFRMASATTTDKGFL